MEKDEFKILFDLTTLGTLTPTFNAFLDRYVLPVSRPVPQDLLRVRPTSYTVHIHTVRTFSPSRQTPRLRPGNASFKTRFGFYTHL